MNFSLRGVKKGFRLRWIFVVAVSAVVVLLAAVCWSWISAQARATVVLASVMETPVLSSAVGWMTGEPRMEDGFVAGNPALVVRPAGEGPWPAVFFVNGTTPEGREHPDVRRLAEGLARAGYLVFVPDLPGLRSDELTPDTVSETIEVAASVAGRAEARGGEVGMIGVSTGATLAVLAAKDTALDGWVSVVAGVAPYADIRTVLSIATTGHYREDGELVRYEAEPFLSYVAARSLVAGLPPGEDRRTLLSELDAVDRLDPNPLSVFRDRPLGDLDPEARSVVELLANEDPGRFDSLYAELPEKTRADLAKLSPLAGDGRIEAPVELASAPRDRYFPTSESYALKSIAPDLRVTVTGALDHADLEFSPARLPAFIRMNGFVVRSLREARLVDSRNAGDQRASGVAPGAGRFLHDQPLTGVASVSPTRPAPV